MPVSTESCTASYPVNDHSLCLPGGYQNPWSLNLSFLTEKDGVVFTQFKGHAGLQGYEGILHGGVIAALFDTAMANCLFYHGVEAVTGDLRVRFVKSVACTDTLEIRTWVVSSCPPLYHLKSEMVVAGSTMARAKARFMQRRVMS
ncbi:MAG: PaaI family thioesterase [Proteobacteria bacterium]|nr:PaaI family thioesterase [Pseudomonadota bacterium]MBU4294515.1 PaaI family thioesterase [Pseudomonadota bacterium]MCG2747051.1 PaaI family thioesterase [Desulfobulbaceae bacterium]